MQPRNRVKKLIIAIDGPVGSGKSTLARRVAELLGYIYIDTGAMYRAVALKALRGGMSLDAGDELDDARARDAHRSCARMDGTQQVLLDGEDVTSAIRTPEVSQAASKVARGAGRARTCWWPSSAAPGEQGGVVMEGRDIGTRGVSRRGPEDFSDGVAGSARRAALARAPAEGRRIDFARTLEEIHERDQRDRERTTSPLVRARGCSVVDSTAMEPKRSRGCGDAGAQRPAESARRDS